MNDLKKIPLFGARKHARRLLVEIERLHAELDRVGGLSLVELERQREAVAGEVAEQHKRLEQERARVEAEIAGLRAKAEDEQKGLQARLADLRTRVSLTEEDEILQEVGIYRCRHPLSDSVAYSEEIKRLTGKVKGMAKKDGGAILANTNWEVNGSKAQGRAMVREYSKLMLRAYNAEADTLVRGLKPFKLDAAVDRLTKSAARIQSLGKTMGIRISPDYHALRIRELEFTSDYLATLAEEKEREREEKARLREERKAQKELELERSRLEKERQHYQNALEALISSGDEQGAARLREQIGDVERAIRDVDYRAANVRAGYVYVISNIGAFGERMVKIGMTRRLDPNDRIRELGDASVPFRYDVHALFFSQDAVGIEGKMHDRLGDQRVNVVNRRREFFYATPSEVKRHLLDLTGDLLHYEEEAEAIEYRQSLSMRNGSPAYVQRNT